MNAAKGCELTTFIHSTNAGAGDFPTWAMFNTKPLADLSGGNGRDGLEPYTCCNDTASVDSTIFVDKGYNRYASDRIAASADAFKITKLEGGSVAPDGSVVAEDLGYKCHANEEHLPLRASITDLRVDESPGTGYPPPQPPAAKSGKPKAKSKKQAKASKAKTHEFV